jgi:DNA (cytosine-5)-methyltransferase 1
VHTIAIEGNGSRPSHKGNGYKETDKMYTLNTTEVHGVAYSMGHDERSAQFTPNKTDPLVASDYKSPPITFWDGGQICSTLTANNADGSQRMPDKNHFNVVCVGNGQVAQTRISDKVGTLNCMHDQQAVMVNKTVRRLTPTECERLQGLPDSWTDVKFNGKPAPDSKRYKAIGNGMATPCSDFIMRRIAEVSNGQNEGHD